MNVNISTILQDTEGRILCLNFSIEKQNYQIMNIYAPTRNSEKTKFYKTLKNYIELKQNLILGGDFNMLEDILLDIKGGNPNITHILGLNYLIKIKQITLEIFGQKKTHTKHYLRFTRKTNRYIAE